MKQVMNFRFLTAITLVVAMSITSPLIADGYRTWKSQNQKHSVKAKLDDYDADSKQLTLIDRDGKTIAVRLNQLSSSDQKYVVRQHERMVAEKNAADTSFKVVRNDSTKKTSRADRKETPTETPTVVRRWGIEWTPRLENAQTVALGLSLIHI